MKHILVVWCVLLGVCAVPGYTQESKYAFAPKVSTLGIGADGYYSINPYVNARLGIQGFQYAYNGTEDDIKYDIDLKLFTISALVDWCPFRNGFRLSAGIVSNQNEIDISAENTASYTIGSAVYTASDVGSLTGKIDFKSAAAYAGIGWGNPFAKKSRWSIACDIGVMFQGKPRVGLDATGALRNNAAFMANLAQEENNLEDALDEYTIYPVIALGVVYRF